MTTTSESPAPGTRALRIRELVKMLESDDPKAVSATSRLKAIELLGELEDKSDDGAGIERLARGLRGSTEVEFAELDPERGTSRGLDDAETVALAETRVVGRLLDLALDADDESVSLAACRILLAEARSAGVR